MPAAAAAAVARLRVQFAAGAADVARAGHSDSAECENNTEAAGQAASGAAGSQEEEEVAGEAAGDEGGQDAVGHFT